MGEGPLQALAAIAPRGWLVGGAVRDGLLGRHTADLDVVLDEPVEPVARRLGRAQRAYCFELSDEFGAWRVVARDRSWQVDLARLAGSRIEEDLGRRDLTINAIARALGSGELIDPFGGRDDLRARRLRCVSPGAFDADPLRVLRLARLACELSFEIEHATLAHARARASRLGSVAGERVFAELRRIVRAPAAVQGLRAMELVGATAAVLPELERLRGVQQSRFHHLDVLEHTLLTLQETVSITEAPERVAGAAGPALAAALAEPLADELTRGEALRLGALLHDIAKPQTRGVTLQGGVTFLGHDEAGALLCLEILGRMRASGRLSEHVASLARHHLRLGFLVREMPLGRRAVYRYLKDTDPVSLDVTVLSAADRLATRGDNSESAIARHLELARQMIAEAITWRSAPPRAPLRGDELARALSLRPGPVIGRLLRELEEASFAGEISSRAEALERARALLGGSAPGARRG
ncbi:MAG TPA: HD domain-containing protein [Solirubrobacteraceae bacterium]|nr:HD domain-containing protein [Solirubrobacteraceae bacterium]